MIRKCSMCNIRQSMINSDTCYPCSRNVRNPKRHSPPGGRHEEKISIHGVFF